MESEISKESKQSPELKGLVLVGGFSKRMGQDKSLISYHEMPHRVYLYQLLKKAGIARVHTSCRADQLAELKDLDPLADKFSPAGPMAALLTAFESDAYAAWLVLACDLPFMDLETIQLLIKNRNPNKIVTAFRSPEDGLPEPLIAIWEPGSQKYLMGAYRNGRRSPRQLMIQQDIHLINASDPLRFLNANDPVSYKEAMKRIENSEERIGP